MTYNFDPDRWLEIHRASLENRKARGEVDEASFVAELEDLNRRYDEMVARLDGTYAIPTKARSTPSGSR
jgi:hypothetical protein